MTSLTRIVPIEVRQSHGICSRFRSVAPAPGSEQIGERESLKQIILMKYKNSHFKTSKSSLSNQLGLLEDASRGKMNETAAKIHRRHWKNCDIKLKK